MTGDIRAKKRASLEFRFISILPPPSLLLSFNYSFGKTWEVFSQQTTANLLHVRTNQLYLTRAIKYQKEQAEDRNNRREEDSRQTEREREKLMKNARLTRALDVVDTFLDEERDGSIQGHEVLQGNAKIVALPGSPGGGVQRLGGLGRFRL